MFDGQGFVVAVLGSDLKMLARSLGFQGPNMAGDGANKSTAFEYFKINSNKIRSMIYVLCFYTTNLRRAGRDGLQQILSYIDRYDW